jgi:DnaJ-class molecular chaperone
MEGLKNGGGGGGGGFGDLFDMFGMGGGQRGPKKPQKGKPVLKELKVTLEDIYSGKLFKLPH